MSIPPKKLSILFVHHGYGYAGGAPVSLVNLILALKSTSCLDMKVVCHDDVVRKFFAERASVPVGKLDDPLTHVGKILIGLARLNTWKELKLLLSALFRFPASVRSQYRLFRAEAPDVIHLNSSTLFSSAIAAKLAHVPVVWHVREIIQGGRYNLRRYLTAGLLKKLATRIIAISLVEARSLGDDQKSKIMVVYNAYDTNLLDPDVYNQVEEKNRLGCDPTTKVVLSLGGMSSNKGTVELIEAMMEICGEAILIFAGPPLKWFRFKLTKQSLQQLRKLHLPEQVVGALKSLKTQGFDTEEDFLESIGEAIGPTLRQQYARDILASAGHQPRRTVRWVLALETVFVKMKMKRTYSWYYPQRVKFVLERLPQNCVKFVGKVKNVAPLLAACDVLVFAGTVPHFPRPVYEAGLMRKPVVVFEKQGITDNVDNGITGIVVKNHSGKAFGKALCSLLNQPEKMQAMGEAGYKKAHALPNAEEGASLVAAIYQEILST
jgi:glycosyltransferase involved in cell wall biosynthesis